LGKKGERERGEFLKQAGLGRRLKNGRGLLVKVERNVGKRGGKAFGGKTNKIRGKAGGVLSG